MKKIIISFSLLLSAGLTTVFANDAPTPNEQVLASFKKEFASAQDVRWNKQDNYDKATFLLGASWVVAYFNPAGPLEGCARDIFFNQLPLAVMAAIDKRFAAAVIINVREITNVDGTHYRLILEAKNKKLKVKVDSSGNINEVDKVAK
ncbi:MAG: hypothetical protein SGI96_04900 [Bacteroidota bacterium]|nr:hypothetical protein [Bacteroidota bacterium]